MWVLILTINLCKNKFHVDEMIKIKFGFQNTNTGFETQIRVLIQNTFSVLKIQIRFLKPELFFETHMCDLIPKFVSC